MINLLFFKSVKSIGDRLVAIISLTFLSPLLAILALMVRLKLGSPILFKQQRPGLNDRPFNILKFRTMTDERDSQGNLLPDADRLPAFGAWLRSTSLDELPELINIAKGEMSFVGPRPLLMQYLPRYSPEQKRRHEMKPGLTGWAQINGRNAISWEEKFELDVWYIDNWSLWLDLKIIFSTVVKVLKREGISEQGNVTMKQFMGNEKI